MIKGIKKLLQTTQPFDSSRGQFNNLNLDDVERELLLKERAAELGASNLPPADDAQRDEIATTIDYFFSQIVITTKNQLAGILIAGKKNVEIKFKPQKTQVEIEMDTNECESSLRKVAKTHLQRVFTAKRYLHRTEAEYEEFRVANHLTGPAKYPSKKDANKAKGIILFLFAIELGLNTFVLGDAFPGGMVGVMVEVLLFSFINICLALVFGYFLLREMRHIKKPRRIFWGWVVSAAVILAIIVVNLFFAHYRDAIAASSGSDAGLLGTNYLELGGVAWNSIQESTFALQDFKSYLLWLSGISIVFLSAYKIFGLDDPYPGYGRLQLNLESVTHRYTQECELYAQRTNDVVNTFYKEYRDMASLYKAKKEDAIDYIDNHNAIIDKYEGWIGHLVTAGKALYARYRTEIQLARTDGVTQPKAFLIDFELADDAKNMSGLEKVKLEDYDNPEHQHDEIYRNRADQFKARLELYHGLLKDIENLAVIDPSLSATKPLKTAEAEVSDLLKEKIGEQSL